MQPLRIAIVEDEMIIASDMQDMLLELGYQICGIAATHAEALILAKQEKPDLFLLDITLKGKLDGLQLAQALRQQNLAFIFVTSHSDYTTIGKAKETQPYGYLIKPFSKQDLYATIEMAQGHLRQKPASNSLFVPLGKGKQKVSLKDIQFVKANGNYVEIKMELKRIALRKNLKEFEGKLPAKHHFIRIHKSYLVNRQHIVSYNQFEVTLKDQTKIPIGRTYYMEIKWLLGSV
ncbi:hypothetical protein GCM10023231_11690 [Olivibacter ginsenosidimutans]|uniref:Response regulator transcription factor n=1 Tax=Olivibacter ginsenosidimutans TaxID=1176537 RepID=A0ABP9AST4_9SPHI